MKQRKFKRILALALGMTMIFGALPAAYADETEPVEVVESVVEDEIAAEEVEEIIEAAEAVETEELAEEAEVAETIDAVEVEESEEPVQAVENEEPTQVTGEIQVEEIQVEEIQAEQAEEENPFEKINEEVKKEEEEVLAEENAAVEFAVAVDGTAVTGSPFPTLQEAVNAVPAGGTPEVNVITLSGAWDLTEAQTLNVDGKRFTLTGGINKKSITKNRSLFADNSHMLKITGSGQFIFHNLIFNGGWNGTSEATTGKGIEIRFSERNPNNKVTFDKCEIINNHWVLPQQIASTGSAGVAIYKSGEVTFNETLIQKNVMAYTGSAEWDPNSGAYTGGIYVSDNNNNVIINNCRVLDNVGVRVGAVRLWSSDLRGSFLISNSTFNNNSALLEVDGPGGAVTADYIAEIIIKESDFTNNEGNAGGAFRLMNSNVIDVYKSNFKLNKTNDGAGGAFRIWNTETQGQMRVRECRIEENRAWGGGGGIYSQNVDIGIIDSYICKNSSENPTSGGAGGITVSGGSFTALNSHFDENHCEGPAGGAVRLRNDEVGTLDGVAVLYNCTINNNESESRIGAIRFNVGMNVTIKDCDISHNKAHGAACGALYIESENDQTHEGNVVITDTTFTDNESFGNGGAVLVSGRTSAKHSTVNFIDCTFDNCRSTNGVGGAMSIGTGNEITLSGCTFNNNKAKDDGGAIASGSNLNIIGSNFTVNKAEERKGGAIWLNSGATMDLTKVIFTGNRAKFAGAIYAENKSIVNFNSVEVTGNTASENDGAVVIDNSNINIKSGTNKIIGNGPINLNLTGETVGVLSLTKMNASSKIGVTKKDHTPADGIKFGNADEGAQGAEGFYPDSDSTFYGIVDRDDLLWKKDTSISGETATISRPIRHGDADVSPAVVPVGQKMTVNTYPDDGYLLDKIKVTRRTNNAAVAVGQDGSFTMPAGGVNVEVTFKEDPATFKYPVDIIRPIEYGDVSANPEKALAGESITLITTPMSEMYVISSLRVVRKVGGSQVPVTNNVFTMPEGGVTVHATFDIDPSYVKHPVDIKRPIMYGDVSTNVTEAAAGEYVLVTVTPVNEFYVLEKLEVRAKRDGGIAGLIKDGGTSYYGRFGMPPGGVDITATFKLDPNKIQYPADIIRPIENGNATVDKVTAVRGEEVTVTAIPNSYYMLDKIKVTAKKDQREIQVEEGIFGMPEGGADIRVTFKKDPNAEYPIEVNVNSHSSGSATSSKSVAQRGDEVRITTTARYGYRCTGVTGTYELNGTNVPIEITPVSDTVNSYTFTMPEAKVNIAVTFDRDPNTLYPIEVIVVGNGIAMASPSSAKASTWVPLIIKPDEGYRVKNVSGTYNDGSADLGVGIFKNDEGYEVRMPGYPVKITVTFEEDPNRAWGAELTRPIVHGDASINPKAVPTGEEMTVNTFPDEGYILDKINVISKEGGDIIPVTVDSSGNGIFMMPAGGVNISVTFKEDPAKIKHPVNIIRPIANGDAVANPAAATRGSNVIIEMSPNEGYVNNNIVVTAHADGKIIPVQVLSNGNGSFEMPAGGVSVVVSFKEDPAKIKYPVNIIRPIVNGDIAADKNEAVMGSNITLTATPVNDKYMVDTITVTAIKTNTAVKVTNGIFTMPEGGVNVVATFKLDPAKIEYPVDILRPIAFGNASASPEKAVKGAPVTLTTTPVTNMYIVDTLKVVAKVDGREVPVNNNVFTMPEGGVNVEVTFKLDPAKIKYPVDIKRPISNGDATADPAEAVMNEDVRIITNPENEHYILDKIVVTKKTGGDAVTVTNGKFKMPEGGANVVVTFKPDPQNPPPGMEEPADLIRPIIHGDASLEPARVMAGGTMTVNTTPDTGYELDKIAVTRKTDGSEVPVNGNGAFTMPAGGVDIRVTFKRIGMNNDFESFIIDKTNGTVEIYSNENPANSGEGTVTVFTNNPRLVIITAYSNNSVNFNKIPGSSDVDVSGDYKYTFPVSGLTEGSSRRIYIALKGDVNFNGKILASDAHQIARCATGLRNFDELQMLVGDVDNSDNGKSVSITDAQQTAKYAANISNFVK